MKEIKTKETRNAPRVLSSNARAPKELMRRQLISAKERAKEAAVSEQYDGSFQYSETPVEYAENRMEETADNAAHCAGDTVKQGSKRAVQKANDLRKQHKEVERGTEQRRPSASSESKAAQQGRERVLRNYRRTRQAQQAQGTARQSMPMPQVQQPPAAGSIRAAQKGSEAVKGTVKAVQKSVKAPKHTVKAAERSVKTTQQTVKTTQRAAQATVETAKVSAKAAQVAAKTAVKGAQIAEKTMSAILKAIAAAAKALVASLAAGGWIVALVAIVTALILGLLSLFGVFSANEASDGSQPMTEAIQAINEEYHTAITDKIAELSRGADVVEIICEGDMESLDDPVPNWADVIGIYSILTSFDEQNPSDVTVVNAQNIERLRDVFYDLNSVSFRTETESETVTVTDEFGAIVLGEDGNPKTETVVTRYIYINIVSKDYSDGAELYRFNDDQNEMLTELMQPEYYPLFAELLGDFVGDGGEYGFGFDINPDLPANELGAQIVEAAKKYIGRSYSSMDCSGLVRAAFKDCGLTSMSGLSSTGMAQKCSEMGVLFTDPAQLQAGDLIFFACKDASRGEGYCTDRNRCGSGRCKRWMQIHHVAIYINDSFLIDSIGGTNSVQIRKHWGRNGSEWEWVCFGRPTT